jgi:hypothetical protein
MSHVVRPMEVRRAIAKARVAAYESLKFDKSSKFVPEIYLFGPHIGQELGRVKRKTACKRAALFCMPFRQLTTISMKGALLDGLASTEHIC